jgi:hypothetical protein
MAHKGTIWEISVEGVIFDRPVWIQKAVLIPNADDDFATFSSWGPETNNPTVRTTMLRKTVSVTSTTTLTSTGNFEAAEVVIQDIIQITYSSTGYNLGHWQVATRSNDNAIIVDIGVGAWSTKAGPLNNDTAATYDWKIWNEQTIFALATANDAVNTEIDFTGMGRRGRRFPNLSCASLDSSTKVILYIA